MKYVFVAAALMAATNAELAKPVTDNYLWINEQTGLNKVEIKGEKQPFEASALQLSGTISHKANAKDLRIVPITFSNP